MTPEVSDDLHSAAVTEQREHLIVDLLALADDHEVKKRGHRLRIAAGRAARDDPTAERRIE